MAAGVPVVSSNLSAMPEVLGDAALFANPHDEVLMGNEMLKLVDDENLKTDMILKGKQKAAEYTWQQMVEKTAAGYRKALGS